MNVKRILTFGFIAAVIIAIWYTPTKPFSDLGEGQKVQQFALPNGLQVYVIPKHSTPAVNHTLYVKLGAADEPKGKTGVAHYLEHLMFKGTPEVPSGHYSELVEGLGGSMNAFTSDDMTGYYVTVAREHLESVMLLEADRFKNLEPDAEESARELKVVLEERAQRTDNNPAARLREKMSEALYGGHPYSHPTIGWPKELAALTLEDAMAFYRAHYHANNMVLVLTGDVTEEDARALTKQYYGDLPSKGAHERDWPEVNHVTFDAPIELRDAQVKQRQWVRHYLMPSVTTDTQLGEAEQAMPIMLLAHVLGGSTTSQLYQSLVVNQKIASDLSVNYQSLNAGPGRLSISATPSDTMNMAGLSARLAQALDRLAAIGVSEEDLNRAKVQFKAESIYARDGLVSLARFLGQLTAIDAPLAYYTHWDTLVNRVSVEQVNKALALLIKSRSVTGYLLPQEKETGSDA